MSRLACVLVAACLTLLPVPSRAQTADGLYLVDHYEQTRDPNADLALAEQRAQAEHKRILLEVGGDWCVWCHIIDHYIAEYADVQRAFEGSFVVMKVNMSPDHENRAFLSRYRTSPGYPDFIILDANGRFLAAQDTSELEQGRGYNHDRMLAFAQRWQER